MFPLSCVYCTLFFNVNSATNFTSCDSYSLYALGAFSGQGAYTLDAQEFGVASAVATFNGFAYFNLVSATASSLNQFLLDGLSISQGLAYSVSFSASWRYYFEIRSTIIGQTQYFTFNVDLIPLGNTVLNPFYMTWENGSLTNWPTIEYISQTSIQPLDRYLWSITQDVNSYTNSANVNCKISTKDGSGYLNSLFVLTIGSTSEYPWRFMQNASVPN